MVDKNKNKGSGEFDDEAFDDDFAEGEFDEAAFDEDPEADFIDLPEGDDFESEEWDDEEQSQETGKKAKKQKSSGLSFNTMAIIGAVVLGAGVLVINILNKSAEVQSGQPSIFQSILNIGGVMDGTLFGKDEPATPEEQHAAQDQPAESGFLNSPDTISPPQPAPITPAEGTVAENEPLTPMPTGETPRGPDDTPPPTEATLPTDQTPSEASAVTPPPVDSAAVPEAPAGEPPAPSAEDILKQAMANREQKQQADGGIKPEDATAEKPAEATLSTNGTPSEAPAVTPPVSVPGEDAPVPVIDLAAPEKPAGEPVPEKTAEAPPVPAQTQEEIAANKEAVASLESKLDTLLKRMEQIENDLGTIREDKNANVAEIEKTVAGLKDDISEIKRRPASAPVRESASTRDADETASEEPPPVKKKKPARIKPVSAPEEESDSSGPVDAAAPTPVAKAPAVAKQAVATGRWELRAAQPGRAWVSKPGERDMQGVTVGETLAGIGRITAITYQNGRWTVMGTQGSIQQ